MKIAIAGYGIEGEASYKYWSSNKDNQVTILDQKQPARPIPQGSEIIIDHDVFNNLEGYDLVVRTPSLSPNRLASSNKVTTATREFFSKCPADIIGVTGSKGKGTTASYIASILESAGKKVWLVGNIGNPALDVLSEIKSDDIVVYELSSFQLWDLVDESPHISVVLFIEPEHLDVHEDFQEYIDAKSNIAKYQSENDIVIFYADNEHSRAIASKSKAKQIAFPDKQAAHCDQSDFYYGDQKICSIDSMQIAGNHNLMNICAAIDAVWYYTKDNRIIEQGIRNFKGLKHRLQFIRQLDEVKYYDDSIATTPSSSIAAIKSFSGRKVVILGGSSKGSDFTELIEELSKGDNYAVLIGKEALTIEKVMKEQGFNNYDIVSEDNFSMTKLVDKVHQLAKPGDVVLLSPAAASFGLFKNYADRGDQFIEAVESL